jgi:hypothetical protein
MIDRIWLVEVRLKDWLADIPSLPCGRTLMYVEVLAQNEFAARLHGHDEFVRRLKTDPIVLRRWTELGLSIRDVCTPSAIVIED